MPFANFQNFDACVLHMIGKGYSEEEARKICGHLQAGTEMADFNNQWIEIFRAGDYGPKGNWTPEMLQKVIKNFDAGVWKPPAVLGHPQNDSPAMAWVKKLALDGGMLKAKFEKVQPQLETHAASGRFPNRSAAFYLDPQGKGPVLRHIGFLGAVPPEVKGLGPIQFSDGEFVAIEFKEEENSMSNDTPQLSKEHVSVLTRFAEGLRNLFGGDARPAMATFTEEQFNQKLEAATKPVLEKITALSTQFADSVKQSTDRAAAATADARRARWNAFAEAARKTGKLVPALEAAMAPQVELAIANPTPVKVTFTEGTGKDAKQVTREVDPLDALIAYSEALPAIVPLGDVAGAAHRDSNVIEMRFNETGNLKVDEASVALNTRAEAIAGDLRKQDPKLTELAAFKEGLARARLEGRSRTKAGGIAAGKA